MVVLCTWCRGEDGPNPVTTTINGSPSCQDCRDEYDQQCYDDYRANLQWEQYEREQGSVGPDPRDSNLIDEEIERIKANG